MTPELTCAACRDLLPLHVANRLDAHDHDLVERHLAACAACRVAARQWGTIGDAVLAQSQALPSDAQAAQAWEALRAKLPPRQPIAQRERFMMNIPPTSAMAPAMVAERPAAPRPHARRTIALIATVSVIALSAVLFGALLPHLKHTQGGIAHSATATPPAIAYSTTQAIVIPSSIPGPIIQIGAYRTIIKNATGTVKAQQPSSIFSVNGFVYIVMLTSRNVTQGDGISVKWFFNGADITSELQNVKPDCCSEMVPKSENALQVVFAIKPPTPGYGKAEISYNNTLAYTILFKVVTP